MRHDIETVTGLAMAEAARYGLNYATMTTAERKCWRDEARRVLFHADALGLTFSCTEKRITKPRRLRAR